MKTYTLAIGAAALAVAVAQQSAQATLTLVTFGTGDLVGAKTGYNPLVINYDVYSNGGVFTYIYQFTAFSGAPVTQLTVDAGYVTSILTGSLATYGAYGSVTGTYDAAGSDSGAVEWDFAQLGQPKLETVAFQSDFGPTLGGASANDHSVGSWNDANGGSLVAVPVPEASTVMAGALMLLPFGIGAIRSIRKDRTA